MVEDVYSEFKMLCFGDSITDGFKIEKPYPFLVKDTLGLKEVQEIAISGSIISTYTSIERVSMLNQCYDLTDEMLSADIVSVMGGVNDYAESVPLGTEESTDIKTFYGAMNVFAGKLKELFPNSFIFFMTPLECEIENETTGATQEEIATAIKTVCENKGIACLDLYTRLSGSFEPLEDTVNGDGIHPTQEFHEDYIAPLVANFIRKNLEVK